MDRAVGTVRAVVGVVLVLVLAIGGAFAAGVVGMPRVRGVENHFAGVNDRTTTVESDLVVENPNFFGVSLGGVSVNYTVRLNDVTFANGTKRGVNLSTGNATLAFRTTVSNGKIPTWWASHVRNGETSDLVVTARVHSETFGRTVTLTPVNREISTDILSGFNSKEPRPVNANQPVVSDPILYVNETTAKWGTVSETQTPIQMSFLLYNPKTTPFTITALGYDITMNDVHVGSGETKQGTTIPGKTSRRLNAVTAMRNAKMDAWWVSHLERNQVTDLKIDFYAKVKLPGGQTVRVPLDALTYEKTIDTDIFGNKDHYPTGNGSASASGSGTASGGSGSTTATPGTSSGTGSGGTTQTSTPLVPDGTATPTETRTATATSTPTPTQTTSGGGLF